MMQLYTAPEGLLIALAGNMRKGLQISPRPLNWGSLTRRYTPREDWLTAPISSTQKRSQITPRLSNWTSRTHLYIMPGFGLQRHSAVRTRTSQAIALGPNDAAIYSARGSAYSANRQYTEAIADYSQAIELGLNDASIYTARGSAYNANQQYSKATADFSQAIALNPDDKAIYSARGSAYSANRQYTEAIADYSQAIKLGLNDSATFTARGSAYGGLSRFDLAITDYTQAISLDNNYAAAYYNRALAYYVSRNNQMAIEDFNRVIQTSNDPLMIQNTRGLMQSLEVISFAQSGDGKVALIIPKSTRFLTGSGSASSVTIALSEDKPAPPAGSDIVGNCYKIEPEGAVTDPGVIITLNYTGWNLGTINEQKLSLNYWDNKANQWVKLSGSQVDTNKKTVTAKTTLFGTFGIIGYPLTPASFTAGDMMVSPASVEVNQDVIIALNVANTGELPGKYKVDLLVSGIAEATRDLTINGGETQQATFTLKRAQAGAYAASIGNLKGSFTVLKPAAYAVSGLAVSPTSAEGGMDITVSFNVVNTGEVRGEYTAALYIGDAAEASRKISLAGGESRQVTFTVKRSEPGTYNVSVDKLSGIFHILEPAAFTASELTINPDTIQKGKPLTVNYKVSNTGQISGTYQAVLKVNETVADTQDITLADNESQLISFELTQDKAGAYTVDAGGLRGSFVVEQFKLLLPAGVGGVLLVFVLLMVMVLVRGRRS